MPTMNGISGVECLLCSNGMQLTASFNNDQSSHEVVKWSVCQPPCQGEGSLKTVEQQQQLMARERMQIHVDMNRKHSRQSANLQVTRVRSYIKYAKVLSDLMSSQPCASISQLTILAAIQLLLINFLICFTCEC